MSAELPLERHARTHPVFYGGSRRMKALFARMEKSPLVRGRSDICVRNLLFTLAITCKPKAILEIGAHIGAAALVLGHACRISRYGKLVTVEPSERFFAELQKNISAAGLGRYITPIQGYADDPAVWEVLRRETYQLIFVDARHTYRAVKSQLQMLAPALAENGFMVLHDTSIRAVRLDEEMLGGVRAAILEFCAKNKKFKPVFFESPLWGNDTGTCLVCKQSIPLPQQAPVLQG
jgi:predicted O-methyltransferase YrrM